MKKIIGMVFIGILILNLALFAFSLIRWQLFWLTIIIIAAIAYWLIPKI